MRLNKYVYLKTFFFSIYNINKIIDKFAYHIKKTILLQQFNDTEGTLKPQTLLPPDRAARQLKLYYYPKRCQVDTSRPEAELEVE